MTDRTNRFALHLRDERGMALVMAIGVSFVLAILGASVILFTTSNERSSNRVRAATRAYQIAQAGIDSAAAQLGNSTQAQRVSLGYFSSMPASSKTATIDNGTVSWDAQLFNDSVSGIPKYRWRITSIASVPNPAGGAAVSRTITADIKLAPDFFQTPNTDVWRYIYSRANDGKPN